MHRSLLIAAAAAAQLVITPAAHAQSAGWLPYDHWSHRQIVRLHALGDLPRYDPVRVQQWAADVFALESTDPVWQRRVQEERAGSVDSRLHVTLTAQYVARTDAFRTGRFTPERQWVAPTVLDDISAPGVRAHVRAHAFSALSVTAEAAGHGDAYRVEHLTADMQLTRAHVWGGRRAVGYAVGEHSLVLTTLPRVDGIGIDATPLDAVRAEVFAGRVAPNGHVRAPWALGMRAHIAPHARVDFGVTRVALFGSTDDEGIGVREIAEVLVAANLEPPYADDQVASLDARWRPPVNVIPLELYGEWAMHDIDAGVLLDMPAFTAGVRIPVLPRARALSATLEHTQVSGSCCLNPPWYHHFELADSWTMRGQPLGHPVGGHGREWLVAVGATTPRLLAHASAAWRTRGHENLYAPTRAGDAFALHVAVDAILRRHVHATLELRSEHAREWDELRARGGLQLRF
jgi:hypothetical protein